MLWLVGLTAYLTVGTVLCPDMHTAHLWTDKCRKDRKKALPPRSLPHSLLLTTMLIGQLKLK